MKKMIQHYTKARFGDDPSLEQIGIARTMVRNFVKDFATKLKLTFFVAFPVFAFHFALIVEDHQKATFWAVMWLAYSFAVIHFEKIRS